MGEQFIRSLLARTNGLLIGFVSVLVVVGLTGCDSGNQGENTLLIISGQITSSVDGAPVQGATVNLNKVGIFDSEVLQSSSTNSQGEYSLVDRVDKRCAEVLLSLNVEHQGFKTTVVVSLTSGVETNLVIWTTNGGKYVRCQDSPQVIDVVLKPLDG